MESFLKQLEADIKVVRKESSELRIQMDQVRFSVSYRFFQEYYQIISSKQLSFIETLKKVREEKLSLARFGDGELGMAIDPTRDIVFQRNSFSLQRKLRSILEEPQENLLVGMPQLSHKKLWISMFARYWPALVTLLPEEVEWGNTEVSRPIAFEREGDQMLQEWRLCWEDKRVAIVTGKGSRFRPLPQFFDNARKLETIFSNPRDAYEDLERVKENLLHKKPDIALISLGPAGTVLAAELAAINVQALDVGHLISSYLSATESAPIPESLPVVRG